MVFIGCWFKGFYFISGLCEKKKLNYFFPTHKNANKLSDSKKLTRIFVSFSDALKLFGSAGV